MKIDGISLSEGSSITNMVVASGASFPASPNPGELFYKNTNDGSEGLYVYDDAQWVNTSASTSATFTVTGDVSGTLDGGTDALTLATVGTAGTYKSVTVNAKGLVTSGTNPTTLAGYGITDAVSNTATVTVGTTPITINGSSTTLAGLTSVTSAAFVGAIDGIVGGTTPAAGTFTSVRATAPLAEAASVLGSISGAVNIAMNVGNLISFTVGGALTPTFTNPPASGAVTAYILEVTNGGSAAITWPAAITWVSGSAPTLRASGLNLVGLITRNGGTTYYGTLLG